MAHLIRPPHCVALLAIAGLLSGCTLPPRQAAVAQPACTAAEIGSRICGDEDQEYINKGHIDPSVTQRSVM